MGVNKRYVNKYIIEKHLNDRDVLTKIFESDILFFKDDYSRQFYKLYTKGCSNKEIKKMLKYGRDI